MKKETLQKIQFVKVARENLKNEYISFDVVTFTNTCQHVRILLFNWIKSLKKAYLYIELMAKSFFSEAKALCDTKVHRQNMQTQKKECAMQCQMSYLKLIGLN